MKYNEFKKMMSMIRSTVKNFCRGQLPTVDEAESLMIMMVFKARVYNPHGNDDFCRAVERFVRNEILRVCA